jgi:hypothetical protein
VACEEDAGHSPGGGALGEDGSVMPKVLYEIVIHGVVGDSVLRVVEGFEVVSVNDGSTTLRGWVVDQSGLHAVLDRIGAFGLELTSVAPAAD